MSEAPKELMDCLLIKTQDYRTDYCKGFAEGCKVQLQASLLKAYIDAQVREAESRGYDKACDDIKEGGE